MNIARKRKEYQPIVDTKQCEERGILRSQEFQNRDSERVNILGFSGGKDSIASYLVMVRSGIPFIPVYSLTSVDPPELVQYILKIFNPWAKSKGYPLVVFAKYNKWKSGVNKGKLKTMWALLSNRAIPPTRLARYCCDELKERTGEQGDTIFTGVRWEESRARRERQVVNFYKGKIMVRPIVDWSEVEVWSYILENEIPYCELYDKGFDRLGCIGCPLGSGQKKELALYPNYRKLYVKAFDNMVAYRDSKGMRMEGWKNGEDVIKWWVGDCEVQRKEVDGQCTMF